MILTQLQLQDIARAGGGLSLDASLFTYAQITAIIQAARDGGKATVSLQHVGGLSAAQVVTLASLAPGQVSFDISA